MCGGRYIKLRVFLGAPTKSRFQGSPACPCQKCYRVKGFTCKTFKADFIIEATLPIIADRIGHITPDFYERMFAARPDLMDGLFSRSSQLEGTQPKALAGSIAVFASYIVEHPDSYPDEVLSRVAHKHASL